MEPNPQSLDTRHEEARLAFSITEFCKRHGISRSHFYELEKAGRTPAMMKLGRRVLISVEAAADWRRRMSAV